MLANKHYYRSLIDNKSEPAFLSDLDGEILLVNPAGEKFSGYSEDEFSSYSVRELFFTVKNTPNPFDARNIREFSSEIFILDALRYLVPVFLEFKEIEGNKFLGTIKPVVTMESLIQPSGTDLPARNVRIESTAEQTNKATRNLTEEQEDEFDHNIRNALNAIIGFGTLLSKEKNIVGDQKLNKYVDSIVKSGYDLKKAFNNFEKSEVDHDEISWGPTSVLQVMQKVNIMLASLARKNSIQLKIKPGTDITILSDENILFETLNFLVSKALNFCRSEEVKVDYFINANQTEISISIDNLGQDIPQSVIHFIKRENNKEKYDCNNPILGLHSEIQKLLKNLNNLDAKVDFASTENMGEIATLKIPVRKDIDIHENNGLSDSVELSNDKKMYVLVVEDEKINANIFKMYIQGVANVSLAYSGNEAMNIIELFYNKGIIFSLVFMDIGLPEPWNGIMLKEAIEKKWPEYGNIPFVAQTAYSGKSIADQIINANFKGYLVKPINRNDVLRFIQKFSRK